MLNAKDVAEYFLTRVDEEVGDSISNLKLQKLLYYAQGFWVALHDEPLFGERIEAWEHGPVVPDLYRIYKPFGSGSIPRPANFELSAIPPEVIEVLEDVYDVYGQFSAWKLRNMTHAEPPWKDAYGRGPSSVISLDSLAAYFKTLLN